MKKNLLLLSLAFLICCSSCKDYVKRHYPLRNDWPQFIDFQTGDYWIYKDTLTGNIDSFIVTERKTYIQKFDDYTEDVMQLSGHIYSSGSDTAGYMFRYEVHYNGVVFTFDSTRTDHEIGSSISSNGSPNEQNIIQLPSIAIQGNVFQNVYQVQHTYYGVVNTIWLVKDVGAIRIELKRAPKFKRYYELLHYSIH